MLYIYCRLLNYMSFVYFKENFWNTFPLLYLTQCITQHIKLRCCDMRPFDKITLDISFFVLLFLFLFFLILFRLFSSFFSSSSSSSSSFFAARGVQRAMQPFDKITWGIFFFFFFLFFFLFLFLFLFFFFLSSFFFFFIFFFFFLLLLYPGTKDPRG